MQHKIYPLPLVLFGSEFWGGLIDWFENSLIKEGTINPGDLDLFQIIDDPKEVVAAIFKHYEHRGFEPTAVETEKMLHL